MAENIVLDKKRIKEIEEKAKKYHTISKQMKQAIIVLEKQCDDFNEVINQKNEQITKLLAEITHLRQGNNEQLKKLNEQVKINSQIEVQLENATKALEDVERSKDMDISQLQNTLSAWMSKHEVLLEEMNVLEPRIQELELAQAHSVQVVEELRLASTNQREDTSRLVSEIVRLKTLNTELQGIIADSQDEKKTYESRIQSLMDENEALKKEIFGKEEHEKELNGRINEQMNLIEVLRTENANLNAKRKKKLVERIFGGNGDM